MKLSLGFIKTLQDLWQSFLEQCWSTLKLVSFFSKLILNVLTSSLTGRQGGVTYCCGDLAIGLKSIQIGIIMYVLWRKKGFHRWLTCLLGLSCLKMKKNFGSVVVNHCRTVLSRWRYRDRISFVKNWKLYQVNGRSNALK